MRPHSAPAVMMRAATDSAGTLDNRLITVTGFTMAGDGDTDLGRVVIICCAAAAQRARIHLAGPSRHRRGELPRGHMVASRSYRRNRKLDGCKLFRPEDERQDCHQDRPPRHTYAD